MNILIVEDEPLAVSRLQQLLLQTDPAISIAGVTDSVEGSVAWLRMHPKPDLILMDIELSDGQSFNIFDQVQVTTPVIFTTSYDEYALRAFKVNSIDYLLKPVKAEELSAAITKLKTLGDHLAAARQPGIEQLLHELRKGPKAYRERFLVKTGQRYYSIAVDDIAYFYYQNRVTFLRTWKKETFFVDYILDELEDMLPPKTFFRANRQFLIHVKSVRNIHTYFNHKLKLELEPETADEVIISRERTTEFKEWMGR